MYEVNEKKYCSLFVLSQKNKSKDSEDYTVNKISNGQEAVPS